MQEQYDRNMWKNHNNGDINIGKNRQEHMKKQTTRTYGKKRRQEHRTKQKPQEHMGIYDRNI